MPKNLKKILICIFMFIATFLLGVVGSNTYNFYNSNYEIKFKTNENFDYQKLIDEQYLLTIVNSAQKYSEIDVAKMIKNEDVKITKEGNEYTITTGYQYYQEFFISKSKTKGTRVKQFYIDAISNLVSENVDYEYDTVFIIKDAINIYITGLITGTVGLIISLYLILKKEVIKQYEYDNNYLYKSIFNKGYLKEALSFLSTTKKLVTLAMLFGLMLVCKIFSLPSGFSNLGLSLTYLFFSLISLIFGPIAGLTVGFFSDILGYFLFDKSGMTFYFGYTLQAMLAGLIYGLFFYKSRITFFRCFGARLLVNLVLNVILGSIFFGDIMNYDYETIKAYALVIELPKNIIYLLPQSLLLFVFLKFVSPILYRYKYINKTIYENINII